MLWLFLILGSALVAAETASQQETLLKSVASAAEVRRLSLEEAQRQYPVRLRGVVTFTDNFEDRDFPGIVVNDGTAGVYVHLPRMMELGLGQSVELEGTTGAGGFGPVVRASRCTVLGEGRLPEAQPAVYESIITGQEDNQWVEVRGTVRAVSDARGRGTYLTLLMTGGGRLQCLLVGDVPASADQWVGARVRITGTCLSRFNQNRQISIPWMGLLSASQVVVEKPAPPLPPLTDVDNLMQFHADARSGDRVRVQGVVTSVQRGKSIFIQQGAVGLFVQTTSVQPVDVGDVVEVVGFPVPGPFRPTLEDGVYRRTGDHRVPRVTPVSVEEALTGVHDADLVQLRGTLINRVKRGREQLLAITSGEATFSASLRDGENQDSLADLPNGSTVGLTGICLVEQGGGISRIASPITSFGLLLRSAADVSVLAPPRWWTLQKLLWTVVVLLATLFFIATWVVVLERRVRRQTEIIRHKVAQEVLTEERLRLAREFHDTLQQELAGITMQLDAVDAQIDRSPEHARRLLQLARSVARRCFSEVRRTVWDLRSRFLDANDLPTALAEAVKPLSPDAAVFPRVEVKGEVRPLPPRIESHLLRIGQEAVNNAVKHAQAEHIVVVIEYGADGASLSVTDDGRGFAAGPETASGGHFGLVDMRERAEKIGGRLELRSDSGRGTQVAVHIPYTAQDESSE